VVTADGAGIVSHARTALLGGLAERVGLTGWVDEELAGLGGVRERGGGHGPGRVLSDLAVMIADGRQAIAAIAVLGDQPGLHGMVASAATSWRVLKAVADRVQAGLDALAWGSHVRARARARAWLARAELGGAADPLARAAWVDLDYLVIDLGAEPGPDLLDHRRRRDREAQPPQEQHHLPRHPQVRNVEVQVHSVAALHVQTHMPIKQVIDPHPPCRHHAPPPATPTVVHPPPSAATPTSPTDVTHRTRRSEAKRHQVLRGKGLGIEVG